MIVIVSPSRRRGLRKVVGESGELAVLKERKVAVPESPTLEHEADSTPPSLGDWNPPGRGFSRESPTTQLIGLSLPIPWTEHKERVKERIPPFKQQ